MPAGWGALRATRCVFGFEDPCTLPSLVCLLFCLLPDSSNLGLSLSSTLMPTSFDTYIIYINIFYFLSCEAGKKLNNLNKRWSLPKMDMDKLIFQHRMSTVEVESFVECPPGFIF